MTDRKRNVTRGVLSQQTGVNAETIRYYEKIGLLPHPDRSEGGHRIYSDLHRQRLYFVRRCREMGFTLEEIRGLLSLVDQHEVSCERVQHIAEQQLSNIQAKISDLRRMQATLRDLVTQCSGEDVPECPIIQSLLDETLEPVATTDSRVEIPFEAR